MSIKTGKSLTKNEEFILNIEYEGRTKQNMTKDFLYLKEGWTPVLRGKYEENKPIINLSISVPREWKAISVGKLDKVISNGNYIRYIWDNSHLMGSHPFPFIVIAGKYHQESVFYKNKQINFYLFSNNLTEKLEYLKETKEILELYSSKFGEYPFSKLDIVERQCSVFTPFCWFTGEAVPSIVMLGEGLFGPPEHEFRRILGHEISHQWWCWLVDSDELYNELLAAYSEDLVVGYYYGTEGLNNLDEERLKRYLITMRKKEDSDISMKDILGFRRLKVILGNENFFNSLKTYISRYEGKTARFLEDFKGCCEEITKQDLDLFFKQWFVENIHCDFSIKKMKSRKSFNKYNTEIGLNRDGKIMEPVDVLVNLKDGKEIRKYWDGKEGDTKLILETLSMVKSVQVDPNNRIFDIDRINNNKPSKIKQRLAFDFKPNTNFLYPILSKYDFYYFPNPEVVFDTQLITLGPIIDYNKIDGYLYGLNFEWKYLDKHELKLRGLFGEKTDCLRYHFSYSSYPFHVKRRTSYGISIYDEEGIKGMNIHLADSLKNIIRVGLKLNKEELYSDNFKILLPEDKKDNNNIEFSLSCPVLDSISERINTYLSFERGMKFLEGDYDYSKYFLNIAFPLPTGIKSVLFSKFRAGIIKEENSKLKQFRMGGLEVHPEENDNCLRGYGENQFTGEKIALLNMEYQSKLLDNIVWNVGFDIGKVWGNGNTEDVKKGVGIGLKYLMSPLGSKRTILRFDLGQALEKNTSPKIYLGFGHSF